MSLKCCSTAAWIETSRKLTPRSRASDSALDLVRCVVPKPGMDTAVIPVRGRPKASNARTVTSSASVESRPPERPMTAALVPVWARRVLRPAVCRSRMVSQRSARSPWSAGTKGARGKTRSMSSASRRTGSSASTSSNENSTIVASGASSARVHVVERRRSATRRSRSTSAMAISQVSSLVAASLEPFS